MVSYNLGHVKGADGKGITSITKTGTSGLVDTYTILFTDNTTTTFTVTNGQDGSGGADIVTSWETTLSDEKIPSEKLTKNTIDGKADSNHTHGNIDKDGVLKISGTAQSSKNIVTDSNGKITAEAKPDLSNYIQKSNTAGLMKNDGTIDTTSYLSVMKIGSTSGLPVKTGSNGVLETGAFGTSSGQFAEGNHTHSGYVSATKVTSWSGTVSDSNVPSEKLVKDSLDAKLSATKVTSWSGTTSDSNVPSEKLVKDSLDNKVTGSIANNLTTTTSGYVLDARQGKALSDLIGDAITYINQ